MPYAVLRQATAGYFAHLQQYTCGGLVLWDLTGSVWPVLRLVINPQGS